MADGLFGGFGLPEIGRDAFLTQRLQAKNQQFQNSIQQQAALLPASERGVFSAFANAGNSAIQAFTGGGDISPDQERQFAVVEAATKRLKDLRGTDNFKALAPEEQALAAQDALAKAAADAGDFSTFAQVSMNTAQKRLALRKANKELNKLDADIEGTRARTRDAEVNFDVKSETLRTMLDGSPGTFAVPDEEGNFSENSEIRTAIMNNQGQIVDAGTGESLEGAIPFDDFDKLQDNLADRQRAKSGGKSPSAAFLSNVKERDKVRNKASDVAAGGEIIARAASAIASSANPAGIVGPAGQFVNFANNLSKFATGTAGNFKGLIGKRDQEGNIIPGSQRSISKAAEEFADEIPLPEGIEDQSAAAARYRAAVMQAVYVDARLEEPGARQLSDADIKNAMDRLGVRSGDPRIVMQTLVEGFQQRVGLARADVNRFRNIGKAHGLTGDQASQLLYGTNPLDSFDTAVEKTTNAFSNAFPNRQIPSTSNVTGAPQEQGAQAPAPANVIRVDAQGNIIQ